MQDIRITKQDLVDLDDELDEFGSGIYETTFGSFTVLGLRAQKEEFSLGPIFHKSINNPDDQEPEQLDGICTYGIGAQACAADEAIRMAGDQRLPHLAVIAGTRYEDNDVNDPDEVIIMDPVVIKVIQ